MRGYRCLTSLLAACAALAFTSASARTLQPTAVEALSSACPGPGVLVGRATIAADASLRLSDGRLVTPAGTAWLQSRDNAAAAPNPDHLSGVLADRDIALAEASAPDRWGRQSAHLWVPDEDSEPVLLAALLVEAGLARVAPEELSPECAAFLLAIEAKARDASAGLWPRATVGPWRADDKAGLAGLGGRYALVEGVVRSRGDGRDRLYLNFGRFRENGFVVTIRKRSLNRLPDWGKRVDALEGRRVRIRGVLLEGRQPTIEVAVPGQIERLD
jgi:hypothetical protein